MGFEIIVAHDLNQGIGLNNELPWSCPKDMAYFKSLTIGEDGQNNAVIMGRKTWESIPEKFRPLPKRMNIVLTKSGETFENAYAASCLDQALELAKSSDKVFIIGGAQIYQEALDHNECKQIHVTKIFNRFECDTFFPNYKEQFKCIYASNIWVSQSVNCGFFRFIKSKSIN